MRREDSRRSRQCRFCKEFLEGADGLPVSHHARRLHCTEPDDDGPTRLKRRSAGAGDGAAVNDTIAVGAGGVLYRAVLSRRWRYFMALSDRRPGGQIDPAGAEWSEPINRYARYTGLALLLITIGNAVIRTAQLKSIATRSAPTGGVYAGHSQPAHRQSDMFRVIDLKLHRSCGLPAGRRDGNADNEGRKATRIRV